MKILPGEVPTPMSKASKLFGGLSAVVACVGLAYVSSASVDWADAEQVSKGADSLICEAKVARKQAYAELDSCLRTLANVKSRIYAGNIRRSQELVDGLIAHGFGDKELVRVYHKKSFAPVQADTSVISKVCCGAVAGGVLGVFWAEGKLKWATKRKRSSPEVAISSISENDLLQAAFEHLGGGNLEEGGGGAQQGRAVLAWTIALPVFALVAATLAKQSQVKMDKVQAYLAKAELFSERVDAEIAFINGVITKANMLIDLLQTLNNEYLYPLLRRASQLACGYSHHSEQDRLLIRVFVKVVETVIDVLEVAVVTEEGKLTPAIKGISPEKIIAATRKLVVPLLKEA